MATADAALGGQRSHRSGMHFLNEAALAYPDAVSLAAGRPARRFFRVAERLADVPRFAEWAALRSGRDAALELDELGQYSRTGGVVNELIGEQLRTDEDLAVDPESLLVTNGAQEAMLVALLGLFSDRRDALLLGDPTYLGMSELARLLRIPCLPVPLGSGGLDPEAVAFAAARARARGLRPRALYAIPDFDNPTGGRMSSAARRELVAVAGRLGLTLLEDTAYRYLAFDESLHESLAELAEPARVWVIGSYSKTVCPGLRLGYLAAKAGGRSQRARALFERLVLAKSYLSVATSPIAQAMLGGLLLRSGPGLRPRLAPAIAHYAANHTALVAALREWAPALGCSWTPVEGGFFLTLRLPFPFDDAALRECARSHRVLCVPMRYFSASDARDCEIRLAFSEPTNDAIREAAERLGQFVAGRAG